MIKKEKLFTSLLAGILLFGFFSFSFALEIAYPSIGGKTLSDTSGLTDFVAYFLNLALVLGTVLSVIIIVYAGFNLVNAGGEPAKINEEKKRIATAFLGMILLFGFFIFLNYINPNILNIKNIEVEQVEVQTTATSGICLTYNDKDNKKTYICTTGDINSIKYDITGIEWKSSAEELPAIYVYSQENLIGVPAKVLNGGSLPFSPKSIHLLFKEEGITFYDAVDFNLKSQSMPTTVKEDTVLLPQGFNGTVSSLKIINPTGGKYTYGAVLFPGSGYTGETCSFVMGDISNLANASGNQNNPPIGNNSVSSVAVMKLSSGTVSATLYNRANCQSDPKDENNKKNNICEIKGAFNWTNIKDICPSFVGNPVSFSLSDPVGLLMKTTTKDAAGRCQLFRKMGNSTCINMEKYGYIYSSDIDKPIYPQSFNLFPLYIEE